MSDNINNNKNENINIPKEVLALEPLKTTFDNGIKIAIKTLESLINESDIKCSEGNMSILSAEKLNYDTSNILVKTEFKTGLSGYSFLDIPKELVQKISYSIDGVSNKNNLDEDTILNAVAKVSNQTIDSLNIVLSESIGESIGVGTFDILSNEKVNDFNYIIDSKLKGKDNICKIEYTITISSVLIKWFFVFLENDAKEISDKIRCSVDIKHPSIGRTQKKTLIEYFTLLGIKYRAIYSMVGVIDDLSVLELDIVDSIQCLDIDIINNYNILNKHNDFHNIFIFEKDFVSDIKKDAGLFDDEESTWDVLKELNNQFSNIFLEYCSDKNLSFDDIECNNFLELPDNQYLLVCFSVGAYKFYQLMSLSLLEKIETNFSKADKNKIKDASIESLAVNNSFDNLDINKIPAIYRKVPFEVSAILGEKTFSLGDLLHFDNGYIIHFNRSAVDNIIDIHINNIKKAEGEIGELNIYKSNNYAVKIKKMLKE
ncbi:FliM/FliN family flagellar motor switch protein [Clostridium perfringens]